MLFSAALMQSTLKNPRPYRNVLIRIPDLDVLRIILGTKSASFASFGSCSEESTTSDPSSDPTPCTVICERNVDVPFLGFDFLATPFRPLP